ncbi:MAG: CpsB/CapC family capsule biosynthesis tyrosine phosphatase [candidate division WOR-3 bacterium]
MHYNFNLSWIDLHSHLLPGVDDGPRDIADSLRMAEEAQEDGCDMVFATPHVFHASDIPKRETLEELASLIAGKTGIRIAIGYEVHMLALVEGVNPEGLTLGGTKAILVELPLVNEILAAGDYLSDLVKGGLLPLLAHPERYYYMGVEKLRRLTERGVLAIMNSGSLLGTHGREVKRRAEAFLREGLIYALASDAHSPGDYKRHGEMIRKLLRQGISPALFEPEVEGAYKHELARGDTQEG